MTLGKIESTLNINFAAIPVRTVFTRASGRFFCQRRVNRRVKSHINEVRIFPAERLGKKVGFIEAWSGSPKAVFESA